MMGSIPGLYPLDANSSPQVGATILTLSLLLTNPLPLSYQQSKFTYYFNENTYKVSSFAFFSLPKTNP